MEEFQSNSKSGIKILISVLAALLAGSLFYIYEIKSKTKQLEAVLAKSTSEKESMIKELETLKATYGDAISESTSLVDELVLERNKVVKLINDLNETKGDISKYKIELVKLQNKMKLLLAENENLKKQNTVIVKERDSTIYILDEVNKYNEHLLKQNESLLKSVEKASRLTYLNAKSSAYSLKSSGKQIETDKARSTDLIKISFTIAENQLAKPTEKEYYFQVIDSKNNILGGKHTANFGNKILLYSFISKVKYENKTVNVSEDLISKDFEKGNYFVNVFDKTELVAKSSFTLN